MNAEFNENDNSYMKGFNEARYQMEGKLATCETCVFALGVGVGILVVLLFI